MVSIINDVMFGFETKPAIRNVITNYVHFDIHEKIRTIILLSRYGRTVRFFTKDQLAIQLAKKSTSNNKGKKNKSGNNGNNNQKTKDVNRALKQTLLLMQNIKLYLPNTYFKDGSINTEIVYSKTFDTIKSKSKGISKTVTERTEIESSLISINTGKNEYKTNHGMLLFVMMAKMINEPTLTMVQYTNSNGFSKSIRQIRDIIEDNILFGYSMEDIVEELTNKEKIVKYENARRILGKFKISMKARLVGLSKLRQTILLSFIDRHDINDDEQITTLMVHMKKKSSLVGDPHLFVVLDNSYDMGRKFIDFDKKRKKSVDHFGSFSFMEKGRSLKLKDLNETSAAIVNFFSNQVHSEIIPTDTLKSTDPIGHVVTSLESAFVETFNSVTKEVNQDIANELTSNLLTTGYYSTSEQDRIEAELSKNGSFTFDPTDPSKHIKVYVDKSVFTRDIKNQIHISVNAITDTYKDDVWLSLYDSPTATRMDYGTIIAATNPTLHADISHEFKTMFTEYIALLPWFVKDLYFTPTGVTASGIRMVTAIFNETWYPYAKSFVLAMKAADSGSGSKKDDASSAKISIMDKTISSMISGITDNNNRTLVLNSLDLILMHNMYQMKLETVNRLAEYKFKFNNKNMDKILNDEKFLRAIGIEQISLFVIHEQTMWKRSYTRSDFQVSKVQMGKVLEGSDKITKINKIKLDQLKGNYDKNR